MSMGYLLRESRCDDDAGRVGSHVSFSSGNALHLECENQARSCNSDGHAADTSRTLSIDKRVPDPVSLCSETGFLARPFGTSTEKPSRGAIVNGRALKALQLAMSPRQKAGDVRYMRGNDVCAISLGPFPCRRVDSPTNTSSEAARRVHAEPRSSRLLYARD